MMYCVYYIPNNAWFKFNINIQVTQICNRKYLMCIPWSTGYPKITFQSTCLTQSQELSAIIYMLID